MSSSATTAEGGDPLHHNPESSVPNAPSEADKAKKEPTKSAEGLSGSTVSVGAAVDDSGDKTVSQAETKKRPPSEDGAAKDQNHDDDDNNNQTSRKRPKRNNKNPRSRAKVYVTRGDGNQSDEVHAGSFAHPDMQKQFGVTLPTFAEEQIRVKRKVALLVAYLGTNYGGFQMNPKQRTLQAELELAFYKCQLIAPSNWGHPFKYNWSTSGRTDKGVHACAQVCSAKLEVLPAHDNQTSMVQVLEQVNQHLPAEIRLLEVNRVSRAFCAKTQRDRVRYQYLIPSFMFMDIAKVRSLFEQAGCPQNGRHAGDPVSPEELAVLQPQLRTYRATPAQLTLLKQALAAFEGTHAFHNYSKGVRANESRASRYILSFVTEDPVVFEDSSGMEWIPTQVLGQSFLLHQIRKMVAMAIEVTRGAATLEELEQGLSRDCRRIVAPAPAQGLYLDMSFYEGYNRRKNQNRAKHKNSNVDLPDLHWTDPSTGVYQRWKTFRHDMLMKHVVQEEDEQGNFVKYLYQQEFIRDRDNIKTDDSSGGEDQQEEEDENGNNTETDRIKEE